MSEFTFVTMCLLGLAFAAMCAIFTHEAVKRIYDEYADPIEFWISIAGIVVSFAVMVAVFDAARLARHDMLSRPSEVRQRNADAIESFNPRELKSIDPVTGKVEFWEAK